MAFGFDRRKKAKLGLFAIPPSATVLCFQTAWIDWPVDT
jgi:hypothetical protein